ncbi:cellulase family glycosylhydrolase [Mycobacterium sp. MMS18-G62]
MRRFMGRRLRRYAITTVIAVAPIAIMCLYVTNLLVPTSPLPRPASYAYIPTATIDTSNDTIGVADSDIWGLTTEDGQIDYAEIDKHLDELQTLGVDTVRVLIPWSGNEPVAPGTLPPDWEAAFWKRSDYIINAAAQRGMGVLGVLNSTPAWGADADQSGWGAGAAPDPQKFADYAATVAQRYLGKVSAYEVWNEPNAIPYWTPQPDPASYTEVLKAAYSAIKATDPNALVVAGVLGAVVNFGNVTMDPRDYVEQMYANGAKGYFDALSYHPYQYTTKFSEGALTPDKPWNADSPLEQLIAMRQLMIDNGDAALKIWATEYGLPTAGVNGVTEQQQADFIKDFLDAWHNLDYTGPAFIYTTIDRMDGTEDGSFGIFTKDEAGNWVPKLAAQVIKDAIAARQSHNPPDLGTAIGQLLGQLFQQLFQTLAQNFVNTIAQALANFFSAIFNPTSTVATALALPAETQAAVAEGTTAAAQAVAQMTADSAQKTSATTEKSGLAGAAVAELSAAEEPAAEAVPAAEATAAETTTATATATTAAETPAATATETTATPAATGETPAATAIATATATETATTPASTATSTEVPADEPKSSTETKPTSDATTSEPKASTPGRKESEETSKGDDSKKDADKKSGDDKTDASTSASGGRHAEGTVKNGTSVNDIKAKLGAESTKNDPKPAATAGETASASASSASSSGTS